MMDRWYVALRQAWAIAWRQRWMLIATAWGVCLLGWLVISFVPDMYESEARLYVDTDAVLTPLLRGLAIDTRTQSQLEIMQKTLLSRPNLDKLVDITSLNLNAMSPEERQTLLQRLGTTILVTAEGPNLFTIHYRNANARLAFQVVSGLVNIFMEKAAGSNRTDMQNAQKFLNDQLTSLEVRLQAAEQRRAEFLKKYFDILQLEGNGGISHLDSTRAAVSHLEADLRDARARKAALEEEQHITPPALTTGSGGEGGSSVATQLAEAEAKLAELRAKDTDKNPDVIMQRQIVETLTATAAGRRASPSGATTAGRLGLVNPAYEQLKLRLIETGVAISSLEDQLAAQRKALQSMETLARQAPEVQAQFDSVDRGYNVLRKNYEELLGRHESSMITAAADTDADRVRLRIVDPPQVPSDPVAPNRLLLNSVVLIAGLGAGVGLLLLLGQTDQSVTDLGRLREFGAPVLGGISLAYSPRQRHQTIGQGLRAGAVLLMLVLAYGSLAIHTIPFAKGFL